MIIPTPTPGLGYGGAEYGYSPYGAWAVPREPYPVTGGYGGGPYGYGSYGSLDVFPPRVASATSVDGYRVEVFFSEPMRADAALQDAASYTLTPSNGAPSAVVSVALGTASGSGYASILLTHTGTTLGGSYTVTAASSLVDAVGNTILPTARAADFLAIGDMPTFTAVPTDGSHLLLTFSEDLLEEAEFSPGVASTDAYGFETSYPVAIVVAGVEHPYELDAAKVSLEVVGMTSATYELTVSPAEAFLYDGTILPSTATTFEGVEDGTGTSVAGVSGLLLTKTEGVTYGWAFLDTSGKLVSNTTFRVDVTIDASAATYAPALYDEVLATCTVSDGAVQVVLRLTRVSGVDVVEVDSGVFTAQAPAAWSVAETTLSLVRNQKADLYTILLDGTPILSGAIADFTAVPTMSPGVLVALSSAYAVDAFPIRTVSVTASETVFSASWNFLHGQSVSLVGSSALTRTSLLTKRGPLVKNWGDETPATPQDVTVRVNGIEVEVAAVNPYLGQVTPTIPIPLTEVGTTTVEVDYTWFPNPSLAMAGLNIPGLVLNKWDLHQGWHPPAESPLPATSMGVPDRQRFPMGIVLPPLRRQRPILLGHRYVGFEKAYTAALNSPTTLLLNQNPHRIARDVLQASPSNVSVSYDGDVLPADALAPWSLRGSDAGYVGSGDDDGVYVLVDPVAGTAASTALYVREEDLSFPATLSMAARLQVREWELDGVFTGLAFGFHDDKFLYTVGFLEVNGVKHVGLLRDATRPYLLQSWTVGPAIEITITSPTTFTTTSAAFTTSTARTGSGAVVLQVFDGVQAGVYTVAECGIAVDGDTATVTIDAANPFPADPARWGGGVATAYVEVPWDEDFATYRLFATAGAAQVYVGGFFSDLAISTTRVAAFPAQTVLVLSTTRQGEVFWGSTRHSTTNTSAWGFVRYGIAYEQSTFYFRGIVAAAEMATTPDQDENHEWFVTEDFGYGVIDASGNTLLLKSTASSEDSVLDTTFGYGRLEPFLTNQVLADVDATFRVDSGVLGAGDAQVCVQNGERAVTFGTLLYIEGGDPFRRLVEIPHVAITGIRDPEEDGWSAEGSGLEVELKELPLELVQVDGAAQLFVQYLDTSSPDLTGGRILEARVTVTSWNGLAVNEGPLFGCTAGPLFKDVAAQFLEGGIQLVTRTAPGATTWVAVGAVISAPWDDDAAHTFRIIADPTTDTVVVVVDDVVLATEALTAFTSSTEEGKAYFGAVATSPTTASVVAWEGFSVACLPPATAKRTLGVLRNGGVVTDIDGWELPRTDASSDPNSSVNAVIEEMDWRSNVQVRVRLDPGWGVTVFRPDLPPPPYYTGEFITEYTEPSAGWINVEYRHLPRVASTQRFGRVSFGALDARSVTQQRWQQVRYRIYTRSNEDFIAPQHMVLNWYNVITSGELLKDVTPEVLEVESATSTLVSLVPTHIYADRVFNIVVGDVVLNPTDWTFDVETQSIQLASPLDAEHVAVTVTFAAGKPVTNTYLCSQPLLQSTTLLNEGTPPVPMSQIGSATREEVFGSALNDPTDVLGDIDFILNDPFRTVQFTNEADALYEALEFCTVDDDNDVNLIASVCDGPAPELGWIEVALSGTSFSDAFSLPGGPKAWGGSNVATDTVGGFNQAKILLVSGGRPVTGGTLGPGTAILYPSYPAIAGPDRGAIIRSMRMRMRMSSALTDGNDPVVETSLSEDMDISGTMTDNDPPTEGDPTTDPNPTGPGAPSGNGACIAVLTDFAATTYSRVGPWGGEAALAIRSQLAGGGYPASGNGLVLSGGASLGPEPTVTVINLQAAN